MTELSFDPYATLGVPRGADASRIREAYRRLARQHHPDLASDGRATARMQRINRAWQILSSPTRRARHDADAAVARSPASSHWAGGRRRADQWAPPPQRWSATRPPPRTRYEEEGDAPSWKAIVGVVIAVMVIGPILFIGLPFPFAGLLAFLALGLATGRRA